jgi:serine/threonine-protein phosphatase 2A activator
MPVRCCRGRSLTRWACMWQEVPSLVLQALPPTHARAAPELASYLTVAFGNETRIDYGTGAWAVGQWEGGRPSAAMDSGMGAGHELAFVAWLCCMLLLGVVGPEDHRALVLAVFAKCLCPSLSHTHTHTPSQRGRQQQH